MSRPWFGYLLLSVILALAPAITAAIFTGLSWLVLGVYWLSLLGFFAFIAASEP